MAALLSNGIAQPELSNLAWQTLENPKHPLAPIAEKVLQGHRLSLEEGLALYDSPDLLYVGLLADFARRRRFSPTAEHPEQDRYVYWVHNIHINPTNICEDTCKFCAFKKGPKSPHAYKMAVEDALNSVRNYPGYEALTEVHIVGGHYREMDLNYHVELFKALKREFPKMGIKGLTAAEMDYIAKIEGISVENVLKTLKEAGLDALPGGGAEVFSERVRAQVCPDKISGDRWLDIHGMAHGLGLSSNATMLAGLGETAQERVEHMVRLRQQQDVSGGFMSFIPLNCFYENTKIDPSHALTGVENLKNFAVARLMLDNIAHIKSFWIHIGEKMSQIGLYFGVDDVDGTVIQEKIAHAAGTQSSEHLTRSDLEQLIRNAGRVPVQRDLFYNLL
ncbi:MAG: CofH family radical SAM protein [Vampirovibrionales bacterium]|nr:CofH family radical SAM protein [Vampirovibrionales bacterium]